MDINFKFILIDSDMRSWSDNESSNLRPYTTLTWLEYYIFFLPFGNAIVEEAVLLYRDFNRQYAKATPIACFIRVR